MFGSGGAVDPNFWDSNQQGEFTFDLRKWQTVPADAQGFCVFKVPADNHYQHVSYGFAVDDHRHSSTDSEGYDFRIWMGYYNGVTAAVLVPVYTGGSAFCWSGVVRSVPDTEFTIVARACLVSDPTKLLPVFGFFEPGPPAIEVVDPIPHESFVDAQDLLTESTMEDAMSDAVDRAVRRALVAHGVSTELPDEFYDYDDADPFGDLPPKPAPKVPEPSIVEEPPATDKSDEDTGDN